MKKSKLILSPEQKNELLTIQKEFNDIIKQKTVQIFETGEPKGEGDFFPKPLGSGVLVEYNNLHYLVTAGHVFEDKDRPTIILASGATSFLYICDCFEEKTKWMVSEEPDIAILKFKEDFVQNIDSSIFSFVTQREMVLNHSITDEVRYILLGFPETKTKIFHKEKRTVSEIQSYYLEGLQNKSNANQVALKFPNKGWTSFKNDNTFHAGKLNGMSGCGLWYMCASEVKLVGIFTDHIQEEQMLFATKLDVIHHLLNDIL